MNTSPIAFWCQIWQAQLEQSLKFWSYWAQYTPHLAAREAAAEAEAQKAEAEAPKPRPARSAPRIAVAR